MRALRRLLSTLCLGVLAAGPLAAQQTPDVTSTPSFGGSSLDAVLAEHQSVTDSQRADLTDYLASDEVRQIARDRGVEWTRISGAVATLSDAQIAGLAAMIESPAAPAVQLGTVTVSVAAVIIVLLILILVT